LEEIQAPRQQARYAGPIRLLSQHEPCPQRLLVSVIGDKSEIDQVARQRRIVESAIGIGQEFLGNCVFDAKRRDEKPGVNGARQVDSRLEQDLELDPNAVHLEEGAQAVPIRPHVACEHNGSRHDAPQRSNDIARCVPPPK
jgi:hypothetical protein